MSDRFLLDKPDRIVNMSNITTIDVKYASHDSDFECKVVAHFIGTDKTVTLCEGDLGVCRKFLEDFYEELHIVGEVLEAEEDSGLINVLNKLVKKVDNLETMVMLNNTNPIKKEIDELNALGRD